MFNQSKSYQNFHCLSFCCLLLWVSYLNCATAAPITVHPIDVVAASVGAFATLTDAEQLYEKGQDPTDNGQYLVLALTIINDTPHRIGHFYSQFKDNLVGTGGQTRALMQPQLIESGKTDIAIYRRRDAILTPDSINLTMSFEVYTNNGTRLPLVYKFLLRDDGSDPTFSLTVADMSSYSAHLNDTVQVTKYGRAQIPITTDLGCRVFMNNQVEMTLHFVVEDFNLPPATLALDNTTYEIRSHTPRARGFVLTDMSPNADLQCIPVSEDKKVQNTEAPTQTQMYWIKKFADNTSVIYNALTNRALMIDPTNNNTLSACIPPFSTPTSVLPDNYRWNISTHQDITSENGPFKICTKANSKLCLRATDTIWTVSSMPAQDTDEFRGYSFDLAPTQFKVPEFPQTGTQMFNIVFLSWPTHKLYHYGPYIVVSDSKTRPTIQDSKIMHITVDGTYYNIIQGFSMIDGYYATVTSSDSVWWDNSSNNKYPRDRQWTITKSQTEPPFFTLKNNAFGCYLAKAGSAQPPYTDTDDNVELETNSEEFLEEKLKWGPLLPRKDCTCESTIPSADYSRFKWKFDYVQG